MARSFGKVIVLGEHAVVYGVPAIAAGIERGAEAVARRAAHARVRLVGTQVPAAIAPELDAAFAALLERLGAPPFEVELALELPAGAGLGASAALGVASARAVLEALGAPRDDARVLEAASAWERVFHGNPSGIDAAAAVRGGCFVFTRARGIEPLRLGSAVPLVIAIAGPPARTSAMVARVAELRERRPELVASALDEVGALVTAARTSLEAGDLAELGRLVNENQRVLATLEVSTPAIEHACSIARAAGALGAKLTGSGGGGAVLAVAPDPDPVLAALVGQGFEAFTTVVRPETEASP